MSTKKVAVVGCGYWGKNLVRNFAELGALATVVDPVPAVAQAQAALHGVPASTFEEALANPEVSGVVIAAPAELHADLALRAFAAGKHVFVEKPIALTLEDGERMKAAAAAAGRALMVGHLLQYHPAFVALLGLVKSGELGALRYVYSHRLSLGKFRVEEDVNWSFAPHDVSMILALFGEEPTTVRGDGRAFITPGIEDEYRLDLTFSQGRRAHVFASWLHPFKEQRLVVVGEKAMAVFNDAAAAGEPKLTLYRHGVDTSGRAPEPIKGAAEPVDYPADEPLKAECRHFLEACDGAKVRTDADEALAVLRVLVAGDATSTGH